MQVESHMPSFKNYSTVSHNPLQFSQTEKYIGQTVERCLWTHFPTLAHTKSTCGYTNIFLFVFFPPKFRMHAFLSE